MLHYPNQYVQDKLIVMDVIIVAKEHVLGNVKVVVRKMAVKVIVLEAVKQNVKVVVQKTAVKVFVKERAKECVIIHV